MNSEFFSSLDLALLHNDFYGAYKPASFGGAEEQSGEPFFTVEARDKYGVTNMRAFNGVSITRAICDVMQKRYDDELPELNDWVQEGNSFIFSKRGATRLHLFRGTEAQKLVKSYGGDFPYIAYANFLSNQPQPWQ